MNASASSAVNNGPRVDHTNSDGFTSVCPHFSIASRKVKQTDPQFYCLCTASYCFRCGSQWTKGVGCTQNPSCELWRDPDDVESGDESSTEDAETSSAASTEDHVVFGNSSSTPTSTATADTRPYCRYCSKKFGSREALKQHIDNVTSHSVRKCCGRKFVSEEAYESHARAKHWA